VDERNRELATLSKLNTSSQASLLLPDHIVRDFDEPNRDLGLKVGHLRVRRRGSEEVGSGEGLYYYIEL
jgi:hypothetical protein